MKKRTLYACLLGIIVMLVPALCAAESDDTLGPDLRIMSFNIMHPDWSRVPVKGRDEIVSEILRSYHPDVAAIQEAGAKWHKALKPLLVDTGLYAQACRQCNAEGFIYCCTTFLYDPHTLRLVEENVLDLDPGDAARVLSAAVFERISDGARFVVTNTHPAPREQPEDHQRNMAGLMALISDLRERWPGLPLIMAGDFNTPEQDGYYPELMEKAGVRDAKYEADTLVRGCSTYFIWGTAPDPGSADLCVDHIFVGPGVGVRRFEAVLGRDIERASDHIPIIADIYFIPDQPEVR